MLYDVETGRVLTDRCDSAKVAKEREVAGADWRVFDLPQYSLVRVE